MYYKLWIIKFKKKTINVLVKQKSVLYLRSHLSNQIHSWRNGRVVECTSLEN